MNSDMTSAPEIGGEVHTKASNGNQRFKHIPGVKSSKVGN